MISGSLCLLHSVTLHEDSVVLRVKHTWCQPRFYVERASKSDGDGTVGCILYIDLFTNNYSSNGPDTFILYGQGVFFLHVGLAYGSVPNQEVAYGSRGSEGLRACVRCAAAGLSQGWV